MGWRPTVRGSVMNPNDHPHGGGAGRRQAFVEALGQGTGLAVAGLVRVLAGLVPRHQFQHPHRQSAGLPFQAAQGMQR